MDLHAWIARSEQDGVTSFKVAQQLFLQGSDPNISPLFKSGQLRKAAANAKNTSKGILMAL